MIRRSPILSTCVLLPLSKIYGAVTFLRNKLFDWGILKETEFDVPVVVVGNIAMGGTGKTPHVEHLISALANEYTIGVISRGYKRKTKGFVLASNTSTPGDIGDEPYQIYKKFSRAITLAVCEKRVVGIREIMNLNPTLNLILLDDAFQHRYVKPSIAVVLTEYNRPVFNDKIFPLGRLRESIMALNRADAVVVTKCPDDVKPMDIRLMRGNLNLFPSQKLYFSRYVHGNLVSVFPESSHYVPYLDWLTDRDSVLVVTGIARPRPFVKYLKTFPAKMKVIHFADHHNFDRTDLNLIATKFKELKGEKRLIITTEKDAVRLSNNPYFPSALKENVFYIPIEVEFMSYSDGDFCSDINQLIKEKIKTIKPLNKTN